MSSVVLDTDDMEDVVDDFPLAQELKILLINASRGDSALVYSKVDGEEDWDLIDGGPLTTISPGTGAGKKVIPSTYVLRNRTVSGKSNKRPREDTVVVIPKKKRRVERRINVVRPAIYHLERTLLRAYRDLNKRVQVPLSMCITHFDSDHREGIFDLLQKLSADHSAQQQPRVKTYVKLEKAFITTNTNKDDKNLAAKLRRLLVNQGFEEEGKGESARPNFIFQEAKDDPDWFGRSIWTPKDKNQTSTSSSVPDTTAAVSRNLLASFAVLRKKPTLPPPTFALDSSERNLSSILGFYRVQQKNDNSPRWLIMTGDSTAPRIKDAMDKLEIKAQETSVFKCPHHGSARNSALKPFNNMNKIDIELTTLFVAIGLMGPRSLIPDDDETSRKIHKTAEKIARALDMNSTTIIFLLLSKNGEDFKEKFESFFKPFKLPDVALKLWKRYVRIESACPPPQNDDTGENEGLNGFITTKLLVKKSSVQTFLRNTGLGVDVIPRTRSMLKFFQVSANVGCFYEGILADLYLVSSNNKHKHPNLALIRGIVLAHQKAKKKCKILLTNAETLWMAKTELLPKDWKNVVSFQAIKPTASSALIDIKGLSIIADQSTVIDIDPAPHQELRGTNDFVDLKDPPVAKEEDVVMSTSISSVGMRYIVPSDYNEYVSVIDIITNDFIEDWSRNDIAPKLEPKLSEDKTSIKLVVAEELKQYEVCTLIRANGRKLVVKVYLYYMFNSHKENTSKHLVGLAKSGEKYYTLFNVFGKDEFGLTIKIWLPSVQISVKEKEHLPQSKFLQMDVTRSATSRTVPVDDSQFPIAILVKMRGGKDADDQTLASALGWTLPISEADLAKKLITDNNVLSTALTWYCDMSKSIVSFPPGTNKNEINTLHITGGSIVAVVPNNFTTTICGKTCTVEKFELQINSPAELTETRTSFSLEGTFVDSTSSTSLKIDFAPIVRGSALLSSLGLEHPQAGTLLMLCFPTSALSAIEKLPQTFQDQIRWLNWKVQRDSNINEADFVSPLENSPSSVSVDYLKFALDPPISGEDMSSNILELEMDSLKSNNLICKVKSAVLKASGPNLDTALGGALELHLLATVHRLGTEGSNRLFFEASIVASVNTTDDALPHTHVTLINLIPDSMATKTREIDSEDLRSLLPSLEENWDSSNRVKAFESTNVTGPSFTPHLLMTASNGAWSPILTLRQISPSDKTMRMQSLSVTASYNSVFSNDDAMGANKINTALLPSAWPVSLDKVLTTVEVSIDLYPDETEEAGWSVGGELSFELPTGSETDLTQPWPLHCTLAVLPETTTTSAENHSQYLIHFDASAKPSDYTSGKTEGDPMEAYAIPGGLDFPTLDQSLSAVGLEKVLKLLTTAIPPLKSIGSNILLRRVATDIRHDELDSTLQAFGSELYIPKFSLWDNVLTIYDSTLEVSRTSLAMHTVAKTMCYVGEQRKKLQVEIRLDADGLKENESIFDSLSNPTFSLRFSNPDSVTLIDFCKSFGLGSVSEVPFVGSLLEGLSLESAELQISWLSNANEGRQPSPAVDFAEVTVLLKNINIGELSMSNVELSISYSKEGNKVSDTDGQASGEDWSFRANGEFNGAVYGSIQYTKSSGLVQVEAYTEGTSIISDTYNVITGDRIQEVMLPPLDVLPSLDETEVHVRKASSILNVTSSDAYYIEQATLNATFGASLQRIWGDEIMLRLSCDILYQHDGNPSTTGEVYGMLYVGSSIALAVQCSRTDDWTWLNMSGRIDMPGGLRSKNKASLEQLLGDASTASNKSKLVVPSNIPGLQKETIQSFQIAAGVAYGERHSSDANSADELKLTQRELIVMGGVRRIDDANTRSNVTWDVTLVGPRNSIKLQDLTAGIRLKELIRDKGEREKEQNGFIGASWRLNEQWWLSLELSLQRDTDIPITLTMLGKLKCRSAEKASLLSSDLADLISSANENTTSERSFHVSDLAPSLESISIQPGASVLWRLIERRMAMVGYGGENGEVRVSLAVATEEMQGSEDEEEEEEDVGILMALEWNGIGTTLASACKELEPLVTLLPINKIRAVVARLPSDESYAQLSELIDEADSSTSEPIFPYGNDRIIKQESLFLIAQLQWDNVGPLLQAVKFLVNLPDNASVWLQASVQREDSALSSKFVAVLPNFKLLGGFIQFENSHLTYQNLSEDSGDVDNRPSHVTTEISFFGQVSLLGATFQTLVIVTQSNKNASEGTVAKVEADLQTAVKLEPVLTNVSLKNGVFKGHKRFPANGANDGTMDFWLLGNADVGIASIRAAVLFDGSGMPRVFYASIAFASEGIGLVSLATSLLTQGTIEWPSNWPDLVLRGGWFYGCTGEEVFVPSFIPVSLSPSEDEDNNDEFPSVIAVNAFSPGVFAEAELNFFGIDFRIALSAHEDSFTMECHKSDPWIVFSPHNWLVLTEPTDWTMPQGKEGDNPSDGGGAEEYGPTFSLMYGTQPGDGNKIKFGMGVSLFQAKVGDVTAEYTKSKKDDNAYLQGHLSIPHADASLHWRWDEDGGFSVTNFQLLAQLDELIDFAKKITELSKMGKCNEIFDLVFDQTISTTIETTLEYKSSSAEQLVFKAGGRCTIKIAGQELPGFDIVTEENPLELVLNLPSNANFDAFMDAVVSSLAENAENIVSAMMANAETFGAFLTLVGAQEFGAKTLSTLLCEGGKRGVSSSELGEAIEDGIQTAVETVEEVTTCGAIGDGLVNVAAVAGAVLGAGYLIDHLDKTHKDSKTTEALQNQIEEANKRIEAFGKTLVDNAGFSSAPSTHFDRNTGIFKVDWKARTFSNVLTLGQRVEEEWNYSVHVEVFPPQESSEASLTFELKNTSTPGDTEISVTNEDPVLNVVHHIDAVKAASRIEVTVQATATLTLYEYNSKTHSYEGNPSPVAVFGVRPSAPTSVHLEYDSKEQRVLIVVSVPNNQTVDETCLISAIMLNDKSEPTGNRLFDFNEPIDHDDNGTVVVGKIEREQLYENLPVLQRFFWQATLVDKLTKDFSTSVKSAHSIVLLPQPRNATICEVGKYHSNNNDNSNFLSSFLSWEVDERPSAEGISEIDFSMFKIGIENKKSFLLQNVKRTMDLTQADMPEGIVDGDKVEINISSEVDLKKLGNEKMVGIPSKSFLFRPDVITIQQATVNERLYEDSRDNKWKLRFSINDVMVGLLNKLKKEEKKQLVLQCWVELRWDTSDATSFHRQAVLPLTDPEDDKLFSNSYELIYDAPSQTTLQNAKITSQLLRYIDDGDITEVVGITETYAVLLSSEVICTPELEPTTPTISQLYAFKPELSLNNDWDIVSNSDGPQIEVKDDFLRYHVENQRGYNVWVHVATKEKFSTSHGGCVLRFSVRCNQAKSTTEIKFTLCGGVILRWNRNSFNYQSWSANRGFTTLGPSSILPDSQWRHIVMVVTREVICLFEDGFKCFEKKDNIDAERDTIRPCFHMQALDRGSNLSFDLRDIYVMPGVPYVQGTSLWDYPMLGDLPPSSLLTFKDQDDGGQLSFSNPGFVRFSAFPQRGRNKWAWLQVERKVANATFTYWIRINSSGGSESKVELPGNVILRLTNDGNDISWQTWSEGHGFKSIGPSNIQLGQEDFTAVTLIFSTNSVAIVENGHFVGALESANRGDVSPSVGLQHLESNTDVSIDIGGFRTVPSTQHPRTVNLFEPELSKTWDNSSNIMPGGWVHWTESAPISPSSSSNLSFEWKDQGRGNRKGHLKVELVSVEGEVLATETVPSKAEHEWSKVDITYDNRSDLISNIVNGSFYRISVVVGGGGGHKLTIKNFKMVQAMVGTPREQLKMSSFSSVSVRTMRSVSSGNYMDGRNPEHTGIQVCLSKPRTMNLQYFDWEFTQLPDGTYNIRSLSSGNYLDGRHEGVGNGIHVQLLYRTAAEASVSHYFKWRVQEFTFEGSTRYAIQSVSSGLYLDGRNPEHTGIQLFLTGRKPEGDKYLMWDLGYPKSTTTIRSVS